MFRYIQTEVLLRYLQAEGFHAQDLGLLDAALNRPRASVLGRDAYPTLALKAAAQTQSLIKSHPMMDGNKRPAWFALNAILALNFHLIQASSEEAFQFLIDVEADTLSLEAIGDWIQNRIRAI